MAGRVDYGQVVKNYGNVSKDDARKYCPAKIIGCERKAVLGAPTHKDISTSIVERSHLTLRTFSKRMSRLTCAFSKKWANHGAAVALCICHYNFCRKHRSLKGQTPAMAHGLTTEVWSVRDLLQNVSNR
jgi:hypothetical protein